MFDVLGEKKFSSALSLSKHEESSTGLPDPSMESCYPPFSVRFVILQSEAHPGNVFIWYWNKRIREIYCRVLKPRPSDSMTVFISVFNLTLSIAFIFKIQT